MRWVFWSIVLLCSIAGCTNTSGEPVELPQVEAKPYMIGIASSHVTVPPTQLFEAESGWAQVAEQTDLYKHYGVQLMQGPSWEWTTHFDPQALVDFTEARNISIGADDRVRASTAPGRYIPGSLHHTIKFRTRTSTD